MTELLDAVAMLEATAAGFRLVRKLGSGSRAEVFLGHAGLDTPRTAAIKVFRGSTSAESIQAEVRALSAASHAHVMQLRDLSTGPDGRPMLVLERLEQGTLGQLLSSRGSLAAGEAVTILAPLAAAVSAIHESGVAHGAISPARILFRESGAPVLCGFGYATIGTGGAEGDNRALAALAATVLDRVPEASALRGWLDSMLAYPAGFGDRLSERLFDLATPTPVRLVADVPGPDPVPARAVRAEPVAPEVEPVESTTSRLIAVIEPYLTRVPERFRKPRYAAIAAGALTVVVALVAVPSGGQAAPSVTTTALQPVEQGPVVEDDPVAAFQTLINARNQCIRDLSILCLDAALQPDSVAMSADIALIASIERGDGGEAVIEVTAPILTERMGDAALIRYSGANSEPAGALLVKGAAGWRIRSYLPS